MNDSSSIFRSYVLPHQDLPSIGNIEFLTIGIEVEEPLVTQPRKLTALYSSAYTSYRLIG